MTGVPLPGSCVHLPSGVAQRHGDSASACSWLPIASNDVGLVIKNPGAGLPVALGKITAFPVVMSILGLAAIFGLESAARRPGGILLVIVATPRRWAWPSLRPCRSSSPACSPCPALSAPGHASLIGSMDIKGALALAVLPSVLALVMTAVCSMPPARSARLAGQAGQLDAKGQIPNGGRASRPIR
ncbi:hypothetical protein ACU4GD_40175 [Cupriavidus basilensis]